MKIKMKEQKASGHFKIISNKIKNLKVKPLKQSRDIKLNNAHLI